MPNLRYAEAGPDRLYDSIMECCFITEKVAVTKMNYKLEMIARAIGADERGEDGITPTACAIRALKEPL